MIRIRRLPSLADAADLRQAYLDALPEPQVFYLEERVQKGQAALIRVQDQDAGYAVHDREGTLLEWAIGPPWLPQMDEIFETLLDRLEIERALCKSYDHDLLACCLDRGSGVAVEGLLFCDHADPSGRVDTPWNEARPARPEDASRLWAMGRDFFTSLQEVEENLAKGLLWVYLNGRVLLGCGLFQPVVLGRPAMDVGMVVHPAHRGKGLGTAMVKHLARQVLEQGGRPIAGCAADNLASRRTLERAGFTSRHRLLSFHFASETS